MLTNYVTKLKVLYIILVWFQSWFAEFVVLCFIYYRKLGLWWTLSSARPKLGFILCPQIFYLIWFVPFKNSFSFWGSLLTFGNIYRTIEVPSSRIVIIEGIYALSEKLRPLLDLRVSITGGVHFDLVKRVLRDIQRAGQDPEEIIHQISETVILFWILWFRFRH